MTNRDINILVKARDATGGAFASARKGVAEFGNEVKGVVRTFTLAGVAGGAARSLTAIIHGARGETEKMVEALEHLPFGLGSAIRGFHELFDVINRTAEKAADLKLTTDAMAGNRAAIASGLAGIAALDVLREGFANRANLLSVDDANRPKAAIRQEAESRQMQAEMLQKQLLVAVREEFNKSIGRGIQNLGPSGKGLTDEDSISARRAKLADEFVAAQIKSKAKLDAGEADLVFAPRIEQIRREVIALDDLLKKARTIRDANTDAIDAAFAAASSANRDLVRSELIQLARDQFGKSSVSGGSSGGGPLGAPGSDQRLLTGQLEQFRSQQQSQQLTLEARQTKIAEDQLRVLRRIETELQQPAIVESF